MDLVAQLREGLFSNQLSPFSTHYYGRYDSQNSRLAMLIYPSHGREKGEKEIVPSDRWRTPYNTVSWVYSQDPAGAKKFQHTGSVLLWPSSMGLIGRRQGSQGRDRPGDGDVSLNVDLVGVKAALDPVVSYERDVGFYYKAFPDFEPRELEPLIAIDLFAKAITEEDTKVHRARWDELLANLMHTPLLEANNDSDESSELGASCSSVGDLLVQSTSTLSSVDLTSSDGSFESFAMPSTPRAKTSSNHNVEIKDVSPTGSVTGSLHISSLNASASLFIPPSSSKLNLNDEPTQFPSLSNIPVAHSKLPSLADFTFPTLNPPVSSSSSVRLKKDSEGFFTEDSNATAMPLLPPFLQDSSHRSGRTRKSRTREMVDRLRSELGPNEDVPHAAQKIRSTISPKYASYSPSPLLDDFPPSELITPRRSVSEDGSGEHRRSAFLSSASASASASNSRFSTPEAEDDDGWIDVAHSTPSSSSPKEKSKRTRELFLALTRRRTDSMSSEVLNDLMMSANNSTQEAVDFSGEEVTNTSMSLSSVSLPSTPPPPPAKSVNAFTSPTQARTGPVISIDGWIESPSVAQETSPKVLKEKLPKKDTHQRGKSIHNHHNPGQHNLSSPWPRGSTFQASLPLSQLHPPQQHQPILSLSSFHTSSSTSAYPHRPQLLTHHPHAHVMPHTAAPPPLPPPPPPGTAPMPYFFPPYPAVSMPVNMPVSPLAYSTSFNVMHVPNAYPTTQSFGTPHPPSGYPHMHANSMSAGKAPNLSATSTATALTAMPMPVPVGAGYGGGGGGMNANRKVATGW